MESILVLTHADESGSALTKHSLEAVTAGVELAARLERAAHDRHRGRRCAPPCPERLPSAGPRLRAVSGEAFAQARFASDAAACEALCRAAQATIVLAPQSSRFARVMAAVAHRLGGVIDTHITAALAGASSSPSRPRAGSTASASKLSSRAQRGRGFCCWILERTRHMPAKPATRRSMRLPSICPRCAPR